MCLTLCTWNTEFKVKTQRPKHKVQGQFTELKTKGNRVKEQKIRTKIQIKPPYGSVWNWN